MNIKRCLLPKSASCTVHTVTSGNSKTSGLFNVFMVLWVLLYMSKVPGAHQCMGHHNKKKPLQPAVWWKLQENSSSAAAGPHSCHTLQCSPTSADVTTFAQWACTLAKLPQTPGCTLSKASSTHTLHLDLFWVNKCE